MAKKNPVYSFRGHHGPWVRCASKAAFGCVYEAHLRQDSIMCPREGEWSVNPGLGAFGGCSGRNDIV